MSFVCFRYIYKNDAKAASFIATRVHENLHTSPAKFPYGWKNNYTRMKKYLYTCGNLW